MIIHPYHQSVSDSIGEQEAENRFLGQIMGIAVYPHWICEGQVSLIRRGRGSRAVGRGSAAWGGIKCIYCPLLLLASHAAKPLRLATRGSQQSGEDSFELVHFDPHSLHCFAIRS